MGQAVEFVERLRAELDQLRADHHAELAAARREAAEERARCAGRPPSS